MYSPLVSIITPTYNFEKYIKKCIDSVIFQSYQNWELIIIDDKSKDNTYKFIHEYSKKDKRIQAVRHKRRLGIKRLYITYNEALKKAKGDLIAILEGDDFWPKNKLDTQVKYFKNRKIVLSYGDCVVTDSFGHPFEIREHQNKKKGSWLNNNPTGSILHALADLNFFLEPSTAVIRKVALKKIGGFRRSKYYPAVDIPTWPELALVGRFKYHNEILGYYRRHSGSAWFNFAKKTQAMGRLEMHNFFRDFIKRKKRHLTSLKIYLDMERIEEVNLEFINKKVKRKNLSLLLQNMVFNSEEAVIKMSLKILTDTQEQISIKITALLIMVSLPFHKLITFIIFRLQLMLYQLDKKERKWENQGNSL